MHLNDNSSTNRQCLNIRVSSLIGLAKLFAQTNRYKGLTDSTPCILLSQNEEPTGSQTNNKSYSFYMANPSESAILHSKEEIDQWQKQLATLQPPNSANVNGKQIPFHSGWVGYYAYPSNTNSTAEFHYYPWSI